MTTTLDPSLAAVLGTPGRSRLGWGIGITAGLAVVVGVVAVLWTDKPVVYDTAPAVVERLVVTVSATGTLEATETVEVGAEVSGRLTEVLVDYNDVVTAGQLLARIDPQQLQAAVDQAAAQRDMAAAALAEGRGGRAGGEGGARRGRVQAAQGLVADGDLEKLDAAADRAAAAVKSAHANATVARSNLDAASDKLTRAVIKAPIDGVVLARRVSLGQTVTAGFTTPVLFDLARDLGQLRLVVDVDEADVGRVAEGQEAAFTVDAFPGRTFPTRIVQLRYEPHTTDGVVTYEAVLDVDNPDHALRPGMTATALITVAERPAALLVSAEALRFLPEGEALRTSPTVWVAGTPPRAVEIVAGLSDGARLEVVSGALVAGDEVVLDVASP
jgi:HlyD family secretion protein